MNKLITKRREVRVPAALLSAVAVLLLSSCATNRGDSKSHTVDFSHYNEPLGEQVTNQIKAKVMARLGPGTNTYDRYFVIPFAFENKGNNPEYSHSFISVIRVLADGRQSKLVPELRTRSYRGREYEAFTISWLPRDFPEHPRLCVFEGFGSVVIPSLNKCPLVEGKSFDLPTTLKFAADAKVAVGMWGPYEITQAGFDLGVKRLRLLETGVLKYRADDRGYRSRRVAVNCFHAMSNLDEIYPMGGFLNTGLQIWGLNGTRQVLHEYTTKRKYKGVILEPVDIESDLVGYVYAPDRNSGDIYNPFKSASAYRR